MPGLATNWEVFQAVADIITVRAEVRREVGLHSLVDHANLLETLRVQSIIGISFLWAICLDLGRHHHNLRILDGLQATRFLTVTFARAFRASLLSFLDTGGVVWAVAVVVIYHCHCARCLQLFFCRLLGNSRILSELMDLNDIQNVLIRHFINFLCWRGTRPGHVLLKLLARICFNIVLILVFLGDCRWRFLLIGRDSLCLLESVCDFWSDKLLHGVGSRDRIFMIFNAVKNESVSMGNRRICRSFLLKAIILVNSIR